MSLLERDTECEISSTVPPSSTQTGEFYDNRVSINQQLDDTKKLDTFLSAESTMKTESTEGTFSKEFSNDSDKGISSGIDSKEELNILSLNSKELNILSSNSKESDSRPDTTNLNLSMDESTYSDHLVSLSCSTGADSLIESFLKDTGANESAPKDKTYAFTRQKTKPFDTDNAVEIENTLGTEKPTETANPFEKWLRQEQNDPESLLDYFLKDTHGDESKSAAIEFSDLTATDGVVSPKDAALDFSSETATDISGDLFFDFSSQKAKTNAQNDGADHNNITDFMTFVFPIVHGKQPTLEDITLIRKEGKRRGVPRAVVDHLIKTQTGGGGNVDNKDMDIKRQESISSIQKEFDLDSSLGRIKKNLSETISSIQKDSDTETSFDCIKKNLNDINSLLARHDEQPKLVSRKTSRRIVDRLLETGDNTLTFEEIQQITSMASETKSETKCEDKHLDAIEEVDETENVSAYFSKLSALRQGDDWPDLDLGPVESLLSPRQDKEDIEIDLDAVAFVQKKLDLDTANDNIDVDWENSITKTTSEQIEVTDDVENEKIMDTNSEQDHDVQVSENEITKTTSEQSINHCNLTPERSIIQQEESMLHNLSINDEKKEELSITSLSAKVMEELESYCEEPIQLPSHDKKLDPPDQKNSEVNSEYSAGPIGLALVNSNNPEMAVMSSIRSSTSTDSADASIDDDIHRQVSGSSSDSVSTINSHSSEREKWLRKQEALAEFKQKTMERDSMAGQGTTAQTLNELTRQRANLGFNHARGMHMSHHWRKTYKERTKGHTGYFHIDSFSLYELSAVMGTAHELDKIPWEDRDVKQFFLHEHSISFSRNWFGVLLKKRGNERVREKVLQPKSMLMPTENTRPERWAEEWYTTYTKPENDSCSRSALSSRSGCSSFDTHSTSSSAIYSEAYSKNSRSYRYDSSYSASSGSSASWIEAPECGTLLNVKPNIGERVTRIHPDYTTYLKRSRWRKKYFPKGTFPY